MNKRIRELAEQAMVETQHEFGGKYLAFSKEKFAELIVADCIRIVEGYCETSPEIYGLPLEILEHFDMELDDE